MPKHETLAAALAAFQAELPSLRKDETGKVQGTTDDGRKYSYDYGYADLAQVAEAVSTCLGQHGMAFTAFPTWTEQKNGTMTFVLTYSLLHEGGEERTGTWPLPDPLRTKPQQVGSAITYARRYAQMAVTNTFPDKEDDDGAAAVPANHRDQAMMSPEEFDKLPKSRTDQTGRERPVYSPPAAPQREWLKANDAEVREMHDKISTTLDREKAVKLYDWMAAKDLHNRQVGEFQTTATEELAGRLSSEALKPDLSVADIAKIKDLADSRGLLKVQVSESETLDQVLHDARELAVHAEVEQAKRETPDPQDM